MGLFTEYILYLQIIIQVITKLLLVGNYLNEIFLVYHATWVWSLGKKNKTNITASISRRIRKI